MNNYLIYLMTLSQLIMEQAVVLDRREIVSNKL
jgi:hypothetical protein